MPISDLSKENQEYLINELNKQKSWVLYQEGDIFKRPDINILIHSTNCFHEMNTSIGYMIKTLYPKSYIEDKKTKYGDKEKLGHFSLSLEKNINTNNELVIFNLYTQYNIIENQENQLKNLIYLKQALSSLADFLYLHQVESQEGYQVIIGVPWMISCNKASNNINEVFSIFRDIFEQYRNYIKILFVDKVQKK